MARMTVLSFHYGTYRHLLLRAFDGNDKRIPLTGETFKFVRRQATFLFPDVPEVCGPSFSSQVGNGRGHRILCRG